MIFHVHRFRSWVFIVTISLTALGCYSQTREFNVSFDHNALLVSDMEASATFYEKVLMLKEIPSPIASKDRKWFSLGGDLQLHLIREARLMAQSDVATHFSVRVDDLDVFILFLDEKNIPYTNWPTTEKTISIRPDGVHQIYIQDPDGYWIEVNDAKYNR